MAPKGRPQWTPKAEPDRPPDGGKRAGRGKGDDGRQKGKGKGDWSNEGYKRKGDWSNSAWKGKGDWNDEGYRSKGERSDGKRGGKASGQKQSADAYSGGSYDYASHSSYEGSVDAGYWGWSAMPVAPEPAPAPPPEPSRPLWREYKADDGTPYYYNSFTGHTQWEKPAALQSQPLSKPTPEAAQVLEKHAARYGSGGATRDMDREEQRRARNNQEGSRAERAGAGMRTDDRRRPAGKGKDPGKKSNVKEQGDFGPPGCNLFVFHLPDDWTDDDLHEYFAPHGTIVSAKAMKELGTGRSRGFGFVSYEDRISAATALKKMQGYKILGKRLKVEFKKGEQEKIDDLSEDFGPTRPNSGGGQDAEADERLIGYLRAISAKNVVESLQEDAEGTRDREPEDAAEAEPPENEDSAEG